MTQRNLLLNLHSLSRTEQVGRALGRALPAQAVCLFSGGMGAGKTTLIKAICAGLGIAPEQVVSPTYTLVNIYPGPPSVYHVDFFRLETPEAMQELDPGDWQNPDGVTLIEWPEQALPLLAGQPLLEFRLAAPAGSPDTRELTLTLSETETGEGQGFGAVFEALLPFAGGH